MTKHQPKNQHEDYAQYILSAILEGYTESQQRPIRAEMRAIDRCISFEEAVPSFFGFLREEMRHRTVLLELYSATPDPEELRSCLVKVQELEFHEFREPVQPNKRRRRPLLVIVSTGTPELAISDAAGFRPTEIEGVHRLRLPFRSDVVLIDVKSVDAPGTGGYRVLGNLKTTKTKGIDALVNDPMISESEVNLFIKANMQYDETHDTELGPQTVASISAQAIQKGLQRGLEKGLEKGLQRGLQRGRRTALLEMAELLLDSTDGLDAIEDASELKHEIERRHRNMTRA